MEEDRQMFRGSRKMRDGRVSGWSRWRDEYWVKDGRWRGRHIKYTILLYFWGLDYQKTKKDNEGVSKSLHTRGKEVNDMIKGNMEVVTVHVTMVNKFRNIIKEL